MKGLIFTYALTYGGVLVSLFRPFTGLLIYICFSLIKPDVLWSYSVPAGNYSRTVFLGLFVGWMFARFGNWRFGRAAWSVAFLVFYVAWSALSATQAADQALAWSIVAETAKIAFPIVVALTLIESIEQVTQIVWTMVISLGYLALEFNLSYYSGENRLVTQGFAGMEEKTVAIMMVIGAGLAFFLAMTSTRMAAKLVAVGAAALMIHVPLFTFSRGGMLGLIAMMAMAFVLIPKRPIHFAFLIAVVAIGLRLAGPEVRAQFFTSFADERDRDYSAQSRVELWGQAWETIASRPILGIGPRQWQRWSQVRYNWENPKEVHNTWLQSGAELGVPGVGALILFYVTTGLGMWRLIRAKTYGVVETTYARMVLATLAGFAVTSQFITVYGLEAPYFTALVGAGLLKLTSQPAAVPQPVPSVLRTRSTLHGA